jgi:dihydroorotase
VSEGTESTKLGLKGIPALAEELQVARDLYILEYTGGKLHIPTISTKNSVNLIAAAKKKGLNVTCSVAVHNLIFNHTVLSEFDTNFKTLPPLRTEQDSRELIKGVENGTIDFVTSDHAPMNIELKQIEFDNAANGTIGLESAFGALQTVFDLETTIELLTKGRETFGMETPKLKEGMKASLTLFEPETEYEFSASHILSSSKNSMFLNKTLKGTILGTIAQHKLLLNF